MQVKSIKFQLIDGALLQIQYLKAPDFQL